MDESVKHDCAALLAHADWVNALARRLVADAHAAEDLAQDALAAALVRPPPHGRPLRGWLAAVLRNLVRQARRDASHRSARERVAARAETDPSSAELLERLDSHRALVEAVTRLDEPYRAAVLLRWFEGLSPAVIAARTGTPLRTVETRLHRALARLRADLDRAHGGDRRAWLLALLPHARGTGGGPAAALGALVMDAKLKIGLAALAVVGVCSTLVLWRSAASEAAPSRAATVVDAPAVERGDAPAPEEALVEVAAGERHALPAPAPAPAAATAQATPPLLSVRVIDVEHTPVAGVTVRYSDPEHGPLDGLEARTDAAGALALEQPRGGGHLDVVTPGWTCIFRPELGVREDARELVLVVARSLTLGGTVVDERGVGLEGARVAAPLPFGLRARFDAILDESTTVERRTTTDSAGRFELADVPALPDVKLETSLPPYESDARTLPEYDEPALRIVLRAADEGNATLTGRVVDPAGEPVAGAWVALGDASVKSGPGGAFALELAAPRATPGVLRAAKAGYLPAELAGPGNGGWPEPLVLALGGAPLAITGRVVDARGEPVPGAEVWSDEETHFGYIEIESGELSMRAGARVEALLRGDPWTWRTKADAAGRFELGGLLPRDYRVLAFDPRRMLATAVDLPAGTSGAELRLPDDELHPLVAGRVTDLSGAPLAGVRVVLTLRALGEGGPANLLESPASDTDSDGRFGFEGVSRAVHAVVVQGFDFGLEGFQHVLGPEDDVEHLEFAVPMRVHVQIDGDAAADFDQAALLDADGAELTLSIHHGQSHYATSRIRVTQGRSEAFSVSELARTLVLYAGEVELRRMPLTLVRGELNTIRP